MIVEGKIVNYLSDKVERAIPDALLLYSNSDYKVEYEGYEITQQESSDTNHIQISKNFKLYEFQSPDTREVKIAPVLVEKLQKLRTSLKDSVNIKSGYRTITYNKKIHGEDNSLHLLGQAVDIKTNNIKLSTKDLIALAVKIGFTGIGIYDDHMHLDIRQITNSKNYVFWDNRKK